MVVPNFLELSVLDKAKLSLKRVVAHACLDTPRHRQLGGNKLSVAGWFVRSDAASDVYIVVRNGGTEHQVRPLVERRDVLRSVLKVADDLHSGHPQLCCGFNVALEVDLNLPVEISFVADGAEHPWRVVHAAASGFKGASLQSVWANFNSGRDIEGEAKNLAGFLVKVSDDILDDLIFGDTRVASLKELLAAKEHAGVERALPFLKYVTANDFCINAVETAVARNAVIVPDPFGYGMAYCDESYIFDNEVNILRFVSSVGEAFYIFQHVGSADAVYFPTKKLMVLTPHLTEGLVKGFVYKLIKDIVRVNRYSTGERVFAGVIASHGRPYHFYYDVAPAVNDIYEAGLLGRIPSILYYKGGDYCSFSALYETKIAEQYVAPAELQEMTNAGKAFYFHVGTVFDHTRHESVARFDRRLNAKARKEIVSRGTKEVVGLMSCYPLIWFGITVQKRSWVEQVDAAINIMNALKKIYPDVGVVFDGWTSPLHPTARDQRETELDNGVVSLIKEGLDPSISVFSVVGADSMKKIQYANCVDAYVGNSATGGLHVARFAGREGVAHLNTKMLNASNHIRKRTRLVAPQHIIDRPEDANLRMDFISYSLDWRVVYDDLVNVIEGVAS